MAKISVKNILGKRNESGAVVHSLISQLHAKIWIEDAEGKLLLNEIQQNNFQFPIQLNGELAGWVKGDEKGEFVANLIMHLLSMETERKKFGAEVLNLYQEINLIFNFSEKLAQTIGPANIAAITLEEASRVIASDHGVVLLWEEEEQRLRVVASSGELFFDEEKINSELSLLLKIILSGHSEIISDLSSLKDAGIISPQIKSVIYSALKVKHRVMGVIILASHQPDEYTAAGLKLLTTLALQSSSAIESALLYQKNIREANEREEAMRKIFEVTGKFVPHEFIRSLGHEVITDVKLGDQVEKIVTVLFSDIRDYTGLSEKMTPEETFSFVCLFNERMGPIIRRHRGFVNQYLGDSIMAIFPVNASDALAAAVDMQKELQQFNLTRLLENKPPIQIGVGMHTGPLIMGITGDVDRMDACTISDTVNTASRVESLTKHFKTSILLSEASLHQITRKEDFYLRNLGLVQLKGKQESINIYECFSSNSISDQRKKIETISIFNEGVFHYSNKSFTLAKAAFKKVMEFHPDDPTANFFYNNTQKIIDAGIGEAKTGVVKMEEK